MIDCLELFVASGTFHSPIANRTTTQFIHNFRIEMHEFMRNHMGEEKLKTSDFTGVIGLAWSYKDL